MPQGRGLSFAIVASPLHRVVSLASNGMGTFSTTFRLEVFERLNSECHETVGCASDHLVRKTVVKPQLQGTLHMVYYFLMDPSFLKMKKLLLFVIEL